MQFTLTAKAQTSFGSVLTASEQMGLGGFDWLSAFESGAVQGDKGAVMRGELSWPLFFQPSADDNSRAGAVAPYAFAGVGITEAERPAGVEAAVTRAAAFGVGARIGLSEKGSPHSATLALEYAHGDASGGRKAEDRLNARLLLRF